MRVRTEHLAKVGFLLFVLHVGVLIGKRSNPSVNIVVASPKARVTESGSARAQPIVKPSTELLPSVHERLPKMGSPEFDARMIKLGLDPAEVRQFSDMLGRQRLTALRE